jgi:hypothetical protein
VPECMHPTSRRTQGSEQAVSRRGREWIRDPIHPFSYMNVI